MRLGKIRAGAGEEDSTHLRSTSRPPAAALILFCTFMYDFSKTPVCYTDLPLRADLSIKLSKRDSRSFFEVFNKAITSNANGNTRNVEYVL